MGISRQVWAVVLCAAFFWSSSYAVAQQGGEDPNAANLSAKEIENLVAPIALYPDALVAQVLAGATFPDEITAANDWIKANGSLTGDALLEAANKQPWDPSVKALTQFPSVLDNMAQNLSWTSALGEAYYYQQADVMKAVQTLRQQAKAAGNLKSGEQIKVVQQDPQTIVIQPAQPQVVYVPTYNPTVVYGTPYYPPGYSTAALVTTGLVSFGVGMAIGASMNNNCCGWGWNSWNTNWHGGSVTYNRNVYVSNSNVYRNGGRYNGNRPTTYNGNNRYNNNSNNRYGNNRNVSGNTVNKGGNTVNINTGGNNNIGNNRQPGNNGQNRPNNGNNAGNRPNAGNNAGKRPNAGNNAGNRPNAGNNAQARPAADRGYGQQRQAGTNSGAFSGYDKGGNTRAQADRGRTSYGGGGGGNRGGARAGGGGGRRR
jgi:hypothetical protein